MVRTLLLEGRKEWVANVIYNAEAMEIRTAMKQVWDNARYGCKHVKKR